MPKSAISIIIAMVLLLAACSTKTDTTGSQKATLILDYVANTNHTGVYVALEKGYYQQEGMLLEVQQPGDNATSLNLVAAGKAEFGISYQEDITYALTSEQALPIKAIAAIIQHNTSGFASAANKNIHTIKDFEGKTYSGWGSLGEEAVIRAALNQVNADFSTVKMVTSDGSGAEALLSNIDFMWFFEGWDVMKAKQKNIPLNFFPLPQIDPRLDYYTPVFVSSLEVLQNQTELAKKFMKATQKGYQYAIQHPEESAKILHSYAPEYDLELLLESQRYLSQKYQDDSPAWGIMKDSVWDGYTEFMLQNGMIPHTISASECYTNEFLSS